MLHSLVKQYEENNDKGPTICGEEPKAHTTLADKEPPELTLDELIEEITGDIQPIRKNRQAESMYEFLISLLSPGVEELAMVEKDRDELWVQLSKTIQEMETESLDMMLSYLVFLLLQHQ